MQGSTCKHIIIVHQCCQTSAYLGLGLGKLLLSAAVGRAAPVSLSDGLNSYPDTDVHIINDIAGDSYLAIAGKSVITVSISQDACASVAAPAKLW